MNRSSNILFSGHQFPIYLLLFPLAYLQVTLLLAPANAAGVPESLIQDQSLKLAGGKNATAGEFPFIVSLQMIRPSEGNYHYCGGSLVYTDGTQGIVTAASCLQNRIAADIEILAGVYNLSDPNEDNVQRRYIQRFAIHPNFDPITLLNDIAFIVPTTPFDLNPFVQLIPVPSFDLAPEYVGNCTVLGWGTIENNEEEEQVDQLLQKLNTTLVPLHTCVAIYENMLSIDPSGRQICAKGTQDDKTQGPCDGDLGSPLVCNLKINATHTVPVLTGIVSWSMLPCGNSGYPSIYSNSTILYEELSKFKLGFYL